MTEGKTAIVTTIQPAFDPTSGEHVANVHIEKIVKQGRKQKSKRGGFVMLSKEGLRKIELTGAQWSVLAQLLGNMDHTTAEVRIHVTEMAERLGMAQPNVSRIMRELQDRNFVLKLGQGRYRINARLAQLAGADEDIRDADAEPEWSRS